MKGTDPNGEQGSRKALPDSVAIREPAPDKTITELSSESREPTRVAPPPPEEQSAYIF